MTEQTQIQAPPVENEFPDLFSKYERGINEGDVIDAIIVAIEGNHVVVSAALKSDSKISVDEFRNDEGELEVKVNDKVKVKLENIDDGHGTTTLSHLQYKKERAWQNLEQAVENEEMVEGVIRERIKGGYSVHIDGLRTFLPGSLVDLFPIKSDANLIGKTEKFFVERLKHDRMSAILNRRLVRERELTGGDLNNLPFKVGDKVKGTVVAVVDYPDYKAYLRIDEGIHGFVEKDDITWYRINQVSEAVKVDDVIEVKVLNIDVNKKQIKLGAKQLLPDPWEQIEVSYPPGSKIFAKVLTLKDYGAFVEIEDGIEGLVHTSEMDWLNKNVPASRYLEPGQEVEVMMLGYDKEKRQISLGLKQCRPNPWEEFSITYRSGSKIKGKVVKKDDTLGMFILLPGNLTGLIHFSNLSYSLNMRNKDAIKKELDKYDKGKEIEVVVLDVDIAKERIALGIKQLGADPLEKFRASYNEHETIIGTIKKIEEGKRAIVALDDSVDAILAMKEISEGRIEKISDVITVGEEVKLQIIRIDDDSNKIHVSIKATTKVSTKEALRRTSKQFKEDEEEKSKSESSFGNVLLQTLKGKSDDAATSETDAKQDSEENSS